jgi:hypothetical protein
MLMRSSASTEGDGPRIQGTESQLTVGKAEILSQEMNP